MGGGGGDWMVWVQSGDIVILESSKISSPSSTQPMLIVGPTFVSNLTLNVTSVPPPHLPSLKTPSPLWQYLLVLLEIT